MIHSEMDDLYPLYSLGVLDYNEAVEIDSHLADGCDYCLQHVRDAVNFTSGFAALAEPVTPPPALRERVLAAVSPAKPLSGRRSWAAPFSIAALVCAALAVFSIIAVRQSRDTALRLNRAVAERNQLESALQILTEQQTRTVKFGESGNSGHGFLFVNREGGFVFVGSHLPPLAADRTFELWLVPGKGNPSPAGLFRPDPQGRFVLTSQRRISPAEYAAVALSVEPNGGSAAPTTKPFLIVPLKE